MSGDSLAPRRALLSVSDKTGLVDLARALVGRGVRLVSTGGTAAALRKAGLVVDDVSAVTGHPEIMGGRVKTLHPKVHGGLLARLPGDEAELVAHGIEAFDLLVVNLYPFEQAVARAPAPDELPLDELVEEIDVGGPAMLRAAAKSFARLAVLSDPAQYSGFLEELAARGGTTAATRARLAVQAYARTAAYDAAIAAELGRRLAPDQGLPARLLVAAERVGEPLRYGENPHQRGALYAAATPRQGLGALRVLAEGRELSFNNLLDLDAALSLVHALPAPAACVIKHAGPCGAAAATSAAAAIEAAWEGDPLSAFGGVVGLNVAVEGEAARVLCERPFVEAIVAPDFSPEALALLTGRKGWGSTVRLVAATPGEARGLELRSVLGGLLVQDRDPGGEPARWEVVTRRAPTSEEEAALRLAWTCVRAVRSNAIVLARGRALVGVGGGLPSRVDAVEHACRKAGERARGAALASDGFFPFPDGVEAAHAAGVTALVQPGGSKKDPDVIARADALGLAMVVTGTRHFRH